MGALRAPAKLTVGQAADDLIAGMRDGTVLDRSGKRYKPATIRSYERSVNVAIKPALGEKALAAVSQGDAQALVDDLHASGLSASTVRNRPLRVIFRRPAGEARWRAIRCATLTCRPAEGVASA